MRGRLIIRRSPSISACGFIIYNDLRRFSLEALRMGSCELPLGDSVTDIGKPLQAQLLMLTNGMAGILFK